MRIRSKVKIRELPNYSWLPEYECLAPGSAGTIVDSFQHPYRWDEFWWCVKMSDGRIWPFYENELSEAK